jgi:3-oxoacyl-[acyl-carrier protein] reductase
MFRSVILSETLQALFMFPKKSAISMPGGYLQDIEGKAAIVTGSTKGIGLEIARLMLSAGADVLVNSRNQKDAETTAEKLGSEHNRGRVRAARGDVGIYEDCEELVRQAVEYFGKVDILVNNAGTSMISDSLELRKDDWERTIRTNLSGPFFMSQTCGRVMSKSGGGSIINISSMFGSGGVPRRLAYCASKHGLDGLTKTLATEWAHYNIRVNSLSPGYIKTPMDYGDQSSGGYSDDEINRRTPAGRYGTTTEVAKAALFLASDFSSYITGANIPVDGGWLAYIGWDKLLNEIK